MAGSEQKGYRVRAIMPYLSQPAKGYRYSTDAVVLGAFAAQLPMNNWADLGTGCGVIASRLAHVWPQSRGLAIERSAVACKHARLNLRPFHITLVHGDVRNFPWRESSLDLVVCNPPFFDKNAFRQSRNPHIRQARHALYGDIVSFAEAIRSALVPWGRFCFVFPLELVATKLEDLKQLGLYPRRQLEIQSFYDREPHGVCLEIECTEGAIEKDTLVLYESPGFYTGQAWQFLSLAQNPEVLRKESSLHSAKNHKGFGVKIKDC